MDEQTQSFLELSAKDDLVPLVADKKAAWLFSADGARILWANSAGAAFFAAHAVPDLARLTALERSPARPHIARIAESGATDKFSIDRLRFYRGLRVMLLTCQCKRIELDTGEAAALIVCGDKGLAATKDPVTGFAHMLASDTSTVFVTNGGAVVDSLGALSGTPEELDLPADQQALFGPIELNGTFHDGSVLKVSDGQRLVVLENAPLKDETEDSDPATSSVTAGLAAGAAALAAGAAANAADTAGAAETGKDIIEPHPADQLETEESSAWVRADDADPLPDEDDIAEQIPPAVEEAADDGQPRAADTGDATHPDHDVVTSTAETVQDSSEPPFEESADLSQDAEPGPLAEDIPQAAADSVETEHPVDQTDASDTSSAEGFVFQPRRRPVRFAWKMDIDQRFTFLSDEFADVLGPAATDIIGQTWAEVAGRFDLDPRGQIARALDRRDTWSGKTVDWPVSDAALRVPVDMAALPAFDRNRKFEGYRGFGVCRTADAVQDDDGPALSAAMAAAGAVAATTLAEPAAAGDLDAPGPGVPDLEDTLDNDPASAETSEPDMAAEELNEDRAEDPADPTEVAAEALPEANAPEDAEAADDIAAEPTTEAREPEKAAKTASSLDDLKPAQPDSLAGKTFLGASAAALVGSLARFTGKSGPRRSDPADTAPVPEAADPASATIAEADASETHAPEPGPDQSDSGAEDLPGAALDSKLAALETGDPIAPGNEEATDASAEEAETDTSAEAPGPSEGEPQTDAVEADTPLDEARTPDAPQDSEAGDTETIDAGTDNDAPAYGTDNAVESTDEPVGISGPAALEPAEIETAVKSLAKSYKAAESKSRDLFEDLGDGKTEEDTAAPVDTGKAAEGVLSEEAVDEPEAGDLEQEGPAAEAAREPEQGLEDAHFDVVDADDQVIEATAAELDANRAREDAASEDVAAGSDTEDNTATDEREFFEETAAFETEDKAAAEAEAEAEDTAEPEPPKTGEVIPLATVKPRVVPVDTSGLSRPERAAFRKIAEALGARLEGDLEDFDEPGTDIEEPEDDLPPDVPEAGPIDPSLLDRLPIGIAIVHDREVLYANKALLAMVGYSSVAKLSQVGGLEALFIDDAEELPDAAGMDGEVDEAMKLRLADGGVLQVDAHMHSVPWNGSQGLMISITERKVQAGAAPAAPSSPNFFAEVRSELDSAHSQIAEMDTILETATDGVLVLDQHGTILKVNGSAEALFSANRADMIGAPFTEFLAPESHRAASDYLDGLSRNGVASILNDGREVLGVVPAGGLIPLFMTMGRISGAEDEAKYCAVLRDITQWKTAEEELTQAKRQAEDASSAKSDFLAKISHEIRTPLNAIIGFSEVMMEERFGPIGNDRYKDYLKDIRTSGSHIMSLVNDLLDLSKIEAGKLDLKFSAVSTSDVINECVALMQPQANRERVIIRASLPESVPDVVADPRSLRQIVLNLLSNAIKYNRSGGQVILSTALESNGEVALRVRDTGTGMTAKQLTAALEPFRQLHTASRGGGTGLGLPLTKALVEANRASFHIDSTPDQGTMVEIVFPTQRVLSE